MATGRGYGSVNKHVALAHGVSYVIQYFMFVFCISPVVLSLSAHSFLSTFVLVALFRVKSCFYLIPSNIVSTYNVQ
jgi:hypothetical protein